MEAQRKEVCQRPHLRLILVCWLPLQRNIFLAGFFGPCKPFFPEPSPSREQERTNTKLGHSQVIYSNSLRTWILGLVLVMENWQPTHGAVHSPRASFSLRATISHVLWSPQDKWGTTEQERNQEASLGGTEPGPESASFNVRTDAFSTTEARNLRVLPSCHAFPQGAGVYNCTPLMGRHCCCDSMDFNGLSWAEQFWFLEDKQRTHL